MRGSPPVLLIPKPLTTERVGTASPERCLPIKQAPLISPDVSSVCCRQQEKFGVRRWAKPGRWVPEEENASRAAKTCSGPGVFFFGIAVSKVRLRCCVRESIYLGTSSFPRLVGSSLLSRHNPLIAFWKPEQHFFKKKICLWWQGLQGHVSRSTAQVHH